MYLPKKITAAFLALSFFTAANSHAKEYEFSDLVVFGDSLSDVGSRNVLYPLKLVGVPIDQKMIAGNHPLYVETLASVLTGKGLQPGILGGTNYAFVNATIGGQREIDIKYNLAEYLKNHEVDGNALYLIWGGGNDIAALAVRYSIDRRIVSALNQISGRLFTILDFLSGEDKDPHNLPSWNYFITTTDTAVYMAQTLIDHGAKYVVMPNIYNAGTVAGLFYAFPLVLQTVTLGFAPLFSVPFALRDYNELNQHLNIPGDPGPGTGERFFKERLHAFYQAHYGPIVADLFVALSNLLTDAACDLNAGLEQSLIALGGDHIVYMDIYRLVGELMDNPQFYGFDDILLSTCAGDFTATTWDACKGKKPGIYHSEKNYLWTDKFHPSPQLHQIFAEYMISVFNAPVFMSSLVRQLMAAKSSNTDATFNAVIGINPENITGEVLPLAEVAGTTWKVGEPYDNDARHSHFEGVNLGLLYGANPHLLTGVMVSLALGKAHPYQNFTYHYDSELVNFFGKYNLKGHVWALGELTFGRLAARDIKRTIALGAGKRTESSRTNMGVVGLGFTLGYDWRQREDVIYTPYMRFNFARYHLSGFKEENNLSTSMRYGKSNFNTADLTLALRRAQQFSSLKTYADLGVTAPLQHTPMKILSGLKSTPISFKREVDIHRKPRLKLALGFARYLKPNLSLTGNLNYQVDRRHNQELSYSLGVKTKF